MVGGALSVADIAVTSPFVDFGIAGEQVDRQRWPELAAYVEPIHALPCYAPIAAGDQPRR
jgi:glutathione S-transferase